MDTIIKVVLILFIAISLSCNKDKPIDPDDKLDTIDTIDSIVTIDSNDTIIADPIYIYGDIFIDTSKANCFLKEDIIGHWQLFAFVDIEKHKSFFEPPAHCEKNTILVFNSNDSIKIIALRNHIDTKYEVSNGKLLVEKYNIPSEDLYPDWFEDLYHPAIQNADYFAIQNDTLIILYDQSSKAMLFNFFVEKKPEDYLEPHSNNASCQYGNIILDTSTMGSTDKQDLIGKWQLFAISNIETCTHIFEAPTNSECTVNLEFTATDSIYGRQVTNWLWGDYEIINNTIEIIQLVTTRMGFDPIWVTDIFSPAIYNADIFSIQNDTLALFYDQSKKVMLFKSK